MATNLQKPSFVAAESEKHRNMNIGKTQHKKERNKEHRTVEGRKIKNLLMNKTRTI